MIVLINFKTTELSTTHQNSIVLYSPITNVENKMIEVKKRQRKPIKQNAIINITLILFEN